MGENLEDTYDEDYTRRCRPARRCLHCFSGIVDVHVGAGCAAGRPEQVVAGICALHCRHTGFRHGGRLRQGHPARLQGATDFLVPGRVRGRPRPPAPVLQGFLRDLPQDLSEHPARGTGPHLQRPARQVPHGAARQCRADGGPPADPGRHRVRRQRAICSRSSPRTSAIRPRTSGPAP